jgi:hypothetical protein
MQFKLIIFSQTTENQEKNGKHLNYIIKVVNFDYINLQTV